MQFYMKFRAVSSSSSSKWFIVIIKTKKRNDNNGKTKEWPYGALNHFKTHEIINK